MPYFDPLNEKEDENNPSAVQISGASPSTDSEGNIADKGSKPGLNTGSGFHNLDSYLKVNQPQQFASQFAGKVQGDVNQAKDNQQKASTQFEGLVNSLNPVASQDDINKAVADPTHADAKQYQGWMNASYQGPNNLADNSNLYNQFWGGTQNAQTKTSLLGSDSGRHTLLDSYYGRPQYNSGEKSLDNFYLQQGGIGKQTRGLQNQAAQLSSQGNQQAQMLAGEASKKKGAVEDSANLAKKTVQDAISNQTQAAQDSVNALNSQRQKQFEDLQSGLNSGHLTRDQLNSLGINPRTQIYNLQNLGQYLHGPQTVSLGQGIDPNQRQQIQALQQLSGQDASFGNDVSGGVPISPAFTFDNDSLRQAASNSEAAMADATKRAEHDAGMLQVSPFGDKQFVDKKDWDQNTLNKYYSLLSQYLAPYQSNRAIEDFVS